MTEIQRPGALYQQVAAAIREAILSGEYEPGTPLPSESQLMERYKVSRPTVRNAVSALRAEGLIDVHHGKGSFVRAASAPVVDLTSYVGHTPGGQFVLYGVAKWQQAEEPSTYRTNATEATAHLLELRAGEALFGCDRLLIDPATGTRAMHRTLIPFATAEAVPALAEAPGTDPATAYEMLTKAGHELWWSEGVRARMPLPDERTALRLPDATPVLHQSRITCGTDDQALMLEELRVGADRAELTYRIEAEPVENARP
ncbi:GntR family transcriptional regulator [Streptomyces solicathayae]|uniref:GntR family transcriptional regulator n=1 Tax=Streptomyces solicathayae TaxID=3081768 RepID=A0ABZ0LUX7_9ACTN|nr:GntR family transcriptional regulator [Streptomyces sp. HUAS YS2]WOX23305.1 GntR family transcriptional regulator [Streptomyces sp. HUAS YS2]